LAKKHQDPSWDEFIFAELIEMQAEDLIVDYCERQGYLINGFPTEMRKLFDDEELDEELEELEEEYFCRERFRLYLDTLALEKEDVAELWWFYHHIFWPDWGVNKDEFLAEIKEDLENGSYDVEL